MKAYLLFAIGVVLAGCAASKAALQVASAEQAVRKARAAQADTKATYEYTMAVRYLEKAREEVATSQYQVADALATQAEVWTERALLVADRGRVGPIEMEAIPVAPEAQAPDAAQPPPAPAPSAEPDEFELDDDIEMDADPEPDAPAPETP